MTVRLDEVLTGLGVLGNVLSIPRQIEGQQIQNEQTRMMLKDSGIPDEMIQAATPEPSMRWLSAHQPGFGGKVLGGVGDIGSILTTVVGKPIKAPRLELSDLAEASKLRTGHQQALAKDELGRIIMDPTKTKRDIAAAAIKAGNTDQALRMMRGPEGNPPASILGLRSALENMDDDDPRKPAYQRALQGQEDYNRKIADDAAERVRQNQPPHYDPAESERMRHEQIMKDRADDAAKLGLTGDDLKVFMSTGRPPQAPRPKAEGDELEAEIKAERQRRAAMMRDPVLGKQVPDMEPVENTARRNLAAKQAAKDAQKRGEPIPDAPPPKPKRGATAGATLGGIFGGETPTTTTTTGPPSSTTSTTQNPDADVDAILGSFHLEDQPPEIQQQITDAIAAGTPKRVLANWMLSLQPAAAKPGP